MPAPGALNVGTTPLTGLAVASNSVMVTIDGVTPLAGIGPEPAIVEVDALGGPTTNVTMLPDCVTGVAIERAFAPATVEASVQAATPKPFVAEQAP